ncbi:Gentisate 1,2-dioxygenase [Lachnellula willkommii]|uniref:Gentisate 1,2-dioxygenase n=1 Tax=Lachnellula willkommii TaxID=215461 RepID=A0A559MF11_9HELO|nr:Gentisate 1,2-dioxygenase [Lachnellula willkommii]
MSSTIQTETMALPKDAAEGLISSLESVYTKPLWAQMAKLNPPLPNPSTIPHVWRYNEIRPHLLRAGEVISEKQAERRVAMLVNPARDAPFTTDTIYAGLQLVMPNETAPAHRHTAFAMRFIIEGTGGFTAVHGRRIKMQRGDVILTPTWNWHDHGNDDLGPMIWLDGLDLPNFVHYPVHFVEHYQEKRYPAIDVDTSASPIVFPWPKMQDKLDRSEGDYATESYLKADGSQVSKTLGGRAERLNAGKSSPAVRETASAVYHVIEGSGSTIIDGKKVEWKKSDTFCIPSWHKYQHFANDGERVYLYRFDDKPMINALGFYRTEDTDIESLASLL